MAAKDGLDNILFLDIIDGAGKDMEIFVSLLKVSNLMAKKVKDGING